MYREEFPQFKSAKIQLNICKSELEIPAHEEREREPEFLKSDSNFSLILWTATPYDTWGNVPEKSVNLPILGCNEDGTHGCMHPKLQDKIIVNDKSTLSCTNNEQKQRRFSRTHMYQTTRQNVQC